MSILMKKRPVGRPTKYKPEYCKRLIEHLKSGCTFESFVADLPEDDDVDARTLYRWVDDFPEFCQAKKKGEALALRNWEKIAVAQALTGKGNAATLIFMLKNRYGYRDKIELQPTMPERTALQEMSVEQLEEKIKELKEAGK